MIPFLKNVADVYYKKHGSDVSNFTFVFPTRRAGIFFQKYLAEAARHPIFSPEILTVPELFCKLSPYKTADHIELLFKLYNLYKQISDSQESFDDFMFWGEMVLNDFEDVDKFMVDAEQLFQNIYDLREIDAGFTYFTDEQIVAIRRFWANFIPPDGSESKKEFRELWEVLSDLYTLLKQELHDSGFAYEGMLFREVAERCKKDIGFLLPFHHIVLIGLNGLSKTEEELFKYLNKQGIADFYWDYSSSLVKDVDNKASYFVDCNRMQFRSQYTLEPEVMSLEVPGLEVIGVPSAVGQAKYVHEILDSFIQQNIIRNRQDALNTAIVLPDENLLLPVLYSVPEQIDSINVTMGYSLSNSSIAGLMEHVFNVQRNLRIYNGQEGFYFRFVLSILSHRYIYNITGEDCIKLRQNILQYNKVIVPISDFEGQGILELIFTPLTHWKQIAGYLKSILAQLQYSLLKKKKSKRIHKISAR